MKNKKTKQLTNTANILIIISVFFSLFFIALIGTSMTAAMQAVKIDLNLAPVTTQWLVVSYTILVASFVAIAGQLGDVFGFTKIFIAGLLITFIGYIAASIGTDVSLILISTVLRGIGFACLLPNSMSIIRILFPPEKLNKVLAIWPVITLFGWGLGPLFGGLWATSNWRMTYWIGLGVITPCMLILIYYSSYLQSKKSSKPVDIIGSSLLLFSLITLILLLSEGPFWGWVSPMNISLYAICPILFILFFYSQTKIKQPIVIYSACKSMVFITSLIAFFISFGCYFSLCYFINYYFLSVTGENSSYIFAGISTIPPLMAAVIFSIFTPKLTEKFGYKIIMSIGMLCIFSGMLILLWLPENHSYLHLWWRFIIIGIGMGIVLSSSSPLSQQTISSENSGMASGIYGCFGLCGPSILIPIASSWYTHTEMALIREKLSIYNLSHKEIIKIISDLHTNMENLIHTLKSFGLSNFQIQKAIIDLEDSSIISFGKFGFVCAIVAAIGFIFCLLFAPGKNK
jgi:MFS family permease